MGPVFVINPSLSPLDSAFPAPGLVNQERSIEIPLWSGGKYGASIKHFPQLCSNMTYLVEYCELTRYASILALTHNETIIAISYLKYPVEAMYSTLNSPKSWLEPGRFTPAESFLLAHKPPIPPSWAITRSQCRYEWPDKREKEVGPSTHKTRVSFYIFNPEEGGREI